MPHCRMPKRMRLSMPKRMGTFQIDPLPICDVLDAAHNKGIRHRDLKPAKTLLTKQSIKEAGKTSGSRCPFAEHELASQTCELDYH